MERFTVFPLHLFHRDRSVSDRKKVIINPEIKKYFLKKTQLNSISLKAACKMSKALLGPGSF